MAYCVNCGSELDEASRFCAQCGTGRGASPGSASPAPPASAVLPTRTNGFAVASLVLGIVWIYAAGSVLALVFGYIARSQIRNDPTFRGDGMAIAGIMLGWAGIVGTIGLVALLVAVGDPIDEGSLGLWVGRR